MVPNYLVSIADRIKEKKNLTAFHLKCLCGNNTFFQELYQFYFSEASMLKSGITDNFADVKKQTAYFPLYMQNST